MKYFNSVLISLLGASIGEANCSHDPQHDPSLNPLGWRNHVNQQPGPDVEPMDLEDDNEYDDVIEMERVMELLQKSYLEAQKGK
jgi:hypothetical protein